MPVFVQPSHGFRPPADGSVPIIMVGPGTGVAPFRAFLHERRAAAAPGKNWLFFGDQKRGGGFSITATSWRKCFPTAISPNFAPRSRATRRKKSTSKHRMLENAAELWSWLEDGAHFYVCGDATRMAKDVDDALHKIIETAGGKSADDAKAYVAKLKADKRYQRDVY